MSKVSIERGVARGDGCQLCEERQGGPLQSCKKIILPLQRKESSDCTVQITTLKKVLRIMNLPLKLCTTSTGYFWNGCKPLLGVGRLRTGHKYKHYCFGKVWGRQMKKRSKSHWARTKPNRWSFDLFHISFWLPFGEKNYRHFLKVLAEWLQMAATSK